MGSRSTISQPVSEPKNTPTTRERDAFNTERRKNSYEEEEETKASKKRKGEGLPAATPPNGA